MALNHLKHDWVQAILLVKWYQFENFGARFLAGYLACKRVVALRRQGDTPLGNADAPLDVSLERKSANGRSFLYLRVLKPTRSPEYTRGEMPAAVLVKEVMLKVAPMNALQCPSQHFILQSRKWNGVDVLLDIFSQKWMNHSSSFP